jgi:hypothetical protein
MCVCVCGELWSSYWAIVAITQNTSIKLKCISFWGGGGLIQFMHLINAWNTENIKVILYSRAWTNFYLQFRNFKNNLGKLCIDRLQLSIYEVRETKHGNRNAILGPQMNCCLHFLNVRFFIPWILVQFPQFLSTNAYNCQLIYNNIFKNIKLVHFSDLTRPFSVRTFTGVVQNHYQTIVWSDA